MKTGYLAFLDVLGFGARVAQDDTGESLQAYLELLKGALVGGGGDHLQYVVFSDSVVVTIEGNTSAELREIVLGCSRLFSKMLESEFAMRGAIAFGPFVEDRGQHGSFVAGKALVEAYQYETKQDWVGIMLAPSAVKANPDIQGRCNTGVFQNAALCLEHRDDVALASCLQPYRSIPFHGDSAMNPYKYSGFALLPNDGSFGYSGVQAAIRRARNQLERLKSIAPDPSVQVKIEHMEAFLNVAWQYWAQVPQAEYPIRAD